MDSNLSIFLIMAVAMMAAVTLIIGTTWIRARHRHAALKLRAGEDAGSVAQLSREKEALQAQVEQLAGRLQVLERIATDPGARTAAEIEALR
jgi:cell division protein FtsB